MSINNRSNYRQFLFYMALLVSGIVYLIAGYQLQRHQFPLLVLLVSILFASYIYLSITSLNDNQVKKALWSSIFFRISLIVMLPNLSDDCYRFIWDGRLAAHGFNPFLFLPSSITNTPIALSSGLNPHLYALLNSKEYFTVYPPLLQGVFYTAAKICPDSIIGSIVCMRVFIIGAETASILLLSSLLKRLQLPAKNVLLYALNPLVIFELTGNLHFEAFVIFFLLLFFYFILMGRWVAAIPAFSLAVLSKLLPLIFLPFFINRLGIKKFIIFIAFCFAIIVLFFMPFFDLSISRNIGSSLRLYFQTFEFNGSLFYLMRWIGFQTWGYDPIAMVGKVTPLLVLGGICTMAYLNKQNKKEGMMEGMLFALSIYLAFASIAHPWYIAPLVLLTVFTRYRYAIVWSGLAFLSYSAYSFIPFKENNLLLVLEYFPVYGFAFYEFLRPRQLAIES